VRPLLRWGGGREKSEDKHVEGVYYVILVIPGKVLGLPGLQECVAWNAFCVGVEEFFFSKPRNGTWRILKVKCGNE